MKKRIVISMMALVMVAMSNICFGVDPNSMASPNPTAQNPVIVSTKLVEGASFGEVTVKFYATKDAIDIANKPIFLKMVKGRWLRPFLNYVLKYRIAKMVQIHKDDSLAALEAQAEAAKVK